MDSCDDLELLVNLVIVEIALCSAGFISSIFITYLSFMAICCGPWMVSICIVTLRKKYLYSEFFWPIFSRIRTKYGQIRSISPYSVQMRENTDQKLSDTFHALLKKRTLAQNFLKAPSHFLQLLFLGESLLGKRLSPNFAFHIK